MFCAFVMLWLLLSLVKSSSECVADNSHCLIFGPIKIAYISHINFNFSIYLLGACGAQRTTFGNKVSSSTMTGGRTGFQGRKSDHRAEKQAPFWALVVISYLHFSWFLVVTVFWFCVLILESQRSVNPEECVPGISNKRYGSLC